MTVLLVIHAIIVLLLVATILLQKSSNDGFGGAGVGNMDGFLSGRASANLLSRTTAILATLFLVNSLFLAYLAAHTDRGETLVDVMATAEVLEDDAEPVIEAPVVPDAE